MASRWKAGAESLMQWIEKYKIEAVISNWTSVAKALATTGPLLPGGRRTSSKSDRRAEPSLFGEQCNEGHRESESARWSNWRCF